MTKEDIEMCEYVYNNAVCPVCGMKITYRINPGGGYTQNGCSHPGVKEMIERREQEWIEIHGNQPPRTVRLRRPPE